MTDNFMMLLASELRLNCMRVRYENYTSILFTILRKIGYDLIGL